MSSSALPYKRTPPSWLKITTAEVEDHICKLAKKGLTPSQIGVILRDSHGIAQVNSVTGSKVLRILKGHGTVLNPFCLASCSSHYQDFRAF
jgi:small subunit ribosomal protein S13e